MRTVPLGVNGYFPSFGRQTMSFLVLAGEDALLLDAGTGVSRLIEPAIRELLAPCAALNILLSHYHLDHIVGLSYLPGVWWDRPVYVYGPAVPLVDAEPEDAFDQLLFPPVFPTPWRAFAGPLEVRPVREEELRIGGLELRLWRQDHPGGSIGVRIGDELAYLTDTTVGDANVERVRGVKVLLHELWFTDEEARTQGLRGHSSFSAVRDFAKAAAVGTLLLVHHHPGRTNEEVEVLCARMERETAIPCPLPEEGLLK